MTDLQSQFPLMLLRPLGMGLKCTGCGVEYLGHEIFTASHAPDCPPAGLVFRFVVDSHGYLKVEAVPQ